MKRGQCEMKRQFRLKKIEKKETDKKRKWKKTKAKNIN